MSFPQYPAFLQLVRENDPTRVTEFVANILETPIAKEERLRGHRVSALKLYHAACLKDKAQREAQEAADAVRAASKAKREVERNLVIRKPRQKPLVQVLSIRILRRPKPPPLQSNSSTAKGLSSAFAPSKARSIISRGAMPSLSLASRQ